MSCALPVCVRRRITLYASLLDEIADKQQAAQWLLLAERQMDEASVFTIHGFVSAC